MDPNFTWISDENPLQRLERKWQSSGTLTPSEIELLNTARRNSPDVRIRESCRVLLAAMAGKHEGEPHVQRHLQLRNLARFQATVCRPKSLVLQ